MSVSKKQVVNSWIIAVCKFFCKRVSHLDKSSLSELTNSFSPNLSWLFTPFFKCLFSRFGKYIDFFFQLHYTMSNLQSRLPILICIQLSFLILSFFSSNWKLIASFSLALLHPKSICRCNMFSYFSSSCSSCSSSSSRNNFAFFQFAYLRVCYQTLKSIISHKKEAFTQSDSSFWYSSLTPLMVALIWYMYSVSD